MARQKTKHYPDRRPKLLSLRKVRACHAEEAFNDEVDRIADEIGGDSIDAWALASEKHKPICKLMAQESREKRALIKRPGLLQAAQELGCNYSHLRRVVLGDRVSKSLLTRYHALQRRKIPAALNA